MFIFAIGSIMALYKHLPKDEEPEKISSTEEKNN
jgi:hypothetical protein